MSERRLEFCRACRDERDEIVPAEFILWGKFFPPEQLGPRCYNHTADYIGSTAMNQLSQWAIFDLRPLQVRPLRRLSSASREGVAR